MGVGVKPGGSGGGGAKPGGSVDIGYGGVGEKGWLLFFLMVQKLDGLRELGSRPARPRPASAKKKIKKKIKKKKISANIFYCQKQKTHTNLTLTEKTDRVLLRTQKKKPTSRVELETS